MLPRGWSEDIGADGIKVYRLGDLTTVFQCPVCRTPFVPASYRQKTCGEQRCTWAIRERTPERLARSKARFEAWYADPEHKAKHIEAQNVSKRRRRVAKLILQELSTGERDVRALLSLARPDDAHRALLALWWTGMIYVQGQSVSAVQAPPRRFLRHPPEGTDLPESLRIEVATSPIQSEPHVTPADSWSLSSPEAGTHLSGAAMTIHLSPDIKIPLAHTRALHGILSNLIDNGHHTRNPAWVLVPWPEGCGWAVYVRDIDHAEKLARTENRVRVHSRPTVARFGSIVRLKMPASRAPGLHRLRLDAITPVTIRHNVQGSKSKCSHLYPTGENLKSTLSQTLIPRLKLDFKPDDLCIRIVSRETTPERTWCGEHIGIVTGWVGHLIVECNAPAAWLFDVAGRIGLGARVAFGFGRVKVTEC